MLILSRKVGESVIIDHNKGQIEVYVLRVGGNHVKLGFEAPYEVSVRRGELGGSSGYQGQGNPVPRINPNGGLEGNVQLNEPLGPQ